MASYMSIISPYMTLFAESAALTNTIVSAVAHAGLKEEKENLGTKKEVHSAVFLMPSLA